MNTDARTKVPVTEKALFQRLSRHLAHEGLALKKCRADSRWLHDLGSYYAVEGGAVRETHINLEGWAREAGLMKEYEALAV